MFNRAHHRRIAEVLTSLDPAALANHHCWFGGGTAIALANGEYRESVDIDFLVSDFGRYQNLRELVRAQGLGCLTTRELEQTRPLTADRYGIRTAVRFDRAIIKFEIIHEGRIELDQPDSDHTICGVRVLTRPDQVASKLLANDDRWADRTTYSRDLIDLAMMEPEPMALAAGLRKAETAYGQSISTSVAQATHMLRSNPQQLAEAVRALHVTAPVAMVWQRIDQVSKAISGLL